MTTKLTLSPEALTFLNLPLTVGDNSFPGEIQDATGHRVMTVSTLDGLYDDDRELAAFIAALVNAALAPADAAPGEPGQGSAGVEQASAGRAGDQVKA